MAGTTEATGPDFTQGIALEALPEGEPVGGNAGGEAVALVRRGEEVFAVAGTCTHYGGPIAEGLVVGETIRCPWHHACFSLRTGDPAAPALWPLPRWRTEVVDGVVYVREKIETDPLDTHGRVAEGPSSVVIVGAGAAGNAAADELRRQGYPGPITMVDPDPDAPYDRPNLSKDYLAGTAPEEWIPLRPEGFQAEHGAERIVAAATEIRPDERRVVLSDGRVLDYGALLLATGATPVRLPIPGADLPHVHVLRTLEDSRAIIRGAEAARRAVVIGASFIGLEVAASLRARGLEVDVVAPEAVPFARVLGEELGRFIQGLHERHGVRFHLGRTATSIRADAVVLDDGTELPAELVVVGVGVRPVVELARAAGLRVDGGVVVDAMLETSAAGIFAAGDIARYPDPRSGRPVRIEHWVVAERQGAAAARNILGRGTPYREAAFFWSQHYDVPINYVGHAEGWDSLEMSGDPAGDGCAVAYREAGRLMALATIYRDLESLETEARMDEENRAV